MDTATGDFETHLTLGSTEPTALSRLGTWSAERTGLKLTHIVLDQGATPSQPMLTQRWRGSFGAAFAAAQALRCQLHTVGFSVVRLKLEAAPWNAGVPQTEREARAFPSYCHFEHHLKLLLPSESALESLRLAVQPHGAHLSRNARRTRPDHQHERFVTQRCYGVGQSVAQARLAALTKALAAYTILDSEEEFVLYDSNLALEHGWIQPQELPHAKH